ncbi:SDR family oxidoreductase [Colwellia sp. 12G3]|uniref:SDR family oxidoreductase n=1 Tax=Colwellia sp. 12G3 TaxID=2058299 RepID=UPI000C343CAA|nr:SDR family oxidoreductase [Colwellia sp. 12G3]PKI17852.1 short chain dehydrogenase [Colwellia sp. 12G3]
MKVLAKCLLTGATGGIGEAIAFELAKQGYTLVLHGRNEEKLITLRDRLPFLGDASSHEIVTGDITQTDDRNYILEQAFLNAPVTLLINNAGVSSFNNFINISNQEINEIITVNLIATMQLTQGFLNVKELSKATIVNMGSALGAIGFPGYSAYCASKFGLRGFTESLNREYANRDIRVCYLAPRATNTQSNGAEVVAMNKAMGSKIDPPEMVANALVNLLKSNSNRKSIGWPEKLFARINGLLPELVDSSLKKSLSTILQFTEGK